MLTVETRDDAIRRGLLSFVFYLHDRNHLGADDFPIDIDFEAVLDLTSPILPAAVSDFERLVDEARMQLKNDDAFGNRDGTFAYRLGRVVRDQISEYATLPGEGDEHLYVLEFQGPKQYIKFGRTRNIYRRVSDHLRSANPHGYTLVNG